MLGQDYGSEEKQQTKKKYGPYLESRKRYGEKSKGEKAICRELLKRLQSLVPGLEGGGKYFAKRVHLILLWGVLG